MITNVLHVIKNYEIGIYHNVITIFIINVSPNYQLRVTTYKLRINIKIIIYMHFNL